MNIKKILELVIFRQICEHYQYDLDNTEFIKSYIYQTVLDDENMYTFQIMIIDKTNNENWNVHGVIVDGLVIIRSRD